MRHRPGPPLRQPRPLRLRQALGTSILFPPRESVLRSPTGASRNPTSFGLRPIALPGHSLHSMRWCRLFWAGRWHTWCAGSELVSRFRQVQIRALPCGRQRPAARPLVVPALSSKIAAAIASKVAEAFCHFRSVMNMSFRGCTTLLKPAFYACKTKYSSPADY
jgi:hypothetical protein